jgi:hypothetical protein
MNHNYDNACPCENCLKITFATRFGREQEHEITSAGQQIGNVSTEHEVIGNPQSPRPRSSGYGA